jgi:hypothetical protein
MALADFWTSSSSGVHHEVPRTPVPLGRVGLFRCRLQSPSRYHGVGSGTNDATNKGNSTGSGATKDNGMSGNPGTTGATAGNGGTQGNSGQGTGVGPPSASAASR